MSIDNIKKRLKENSKQDNSWLEKAKWRQKNEDWLDISFAISVKILSAFRTNKKTETFPKNQKELALAMSCTPQYVNKLLKGAENLQLETISKIEQILNIKLIEVPKNSLNNFIDIPFITSAYFSDYFNDLISNSFANIDKKNDAFFDVINEFMMTNEEQVHYNTELIENLTYICPSIEPYKSAA